MKLGWTVGGYWGGAGVARVLVMLLCGGVPALPAAAEANPKPLNCSFTDGASQSYENGVFSAKPSTPLSFHIQSIDLEQQTATLIVAPDAKPGKLSVVRALDANHYLEVVNEGFLNLTTVYEKDGTGKHPAVHSRHGGVVGSPVFAQYTGFCTDE